jgi:hypothetical protein
MTIAAATATEPRAEIDLDEIIRELDAGIDRLPEAALRACQAHGELVTPRLIEVLEEAARLGKQGIVREGNAHFFAIFLLTEFQAKEALPAILELYALHDPVLEGVVGAVTEVPQRVLAVLAGDQPDLVEAMILNRDLDDFIRWGAAATLCQLVRDDRMPRAEALERLARQFRRAIEQRDHWGVTITADELCELNPLEIQEEIKAAFEQGLVDESMFDWKYCEEHLLKPDQPGVCHELCKLKPSAITDTVEELSGWYCFSEAARRESEEYERRQNERDNDPTPMLHRGFAPLKSFDREESDGGTIRHDTAHVGRNDPCPCGRGKKFKKCCLRGGSDQ